MTEIYQLFELELDEISLVDSGANQHANVALFKRHTPPAPAPADTWATLRKAASDHNIDMTHSTTARF